MIDEKFSKAGTSVWDHVVIAYSKVIAIRACCTPATVQDGVLPQEEEEC